MGRRTYVLYDDRGEEDGSVACAACSVRELKKDSDLFPDDYQWHEYETTGRKIDGVEEIKHIRFHSFAGDHQ